MINENNITSKEVILYYTFHITKEMYNNTLYAAFFNIIIGVCVKNYNYRVK